MKSNLKGELSIMDNLKIKPNYAALGRKYGLDWRTVKKYHEGYKGKPIKRKKASRLDSYKKEIEEKLIINRLSIRGVYEFMIDKYGITVIGTYTNFSTYINKHNLKPHQKINGHPRVETLPGVQAQVDWKEDLHLVSKHGEVFNIQLFHIALSYSRYSYIEVSLLKRLEDVHRCLINSFEYFGGVPEELLFDTITTVVVVNSNP